MKEKLPKATLDKLCKESNNRYFVQTGYESGSYTTKYTSDSLYDIKIYYRCILTHSGYKKRLVDTVQGVVLQRYLS